MLLEMWASRCGCLHGHTKAEKKHRRREELGATVWKCYGRRGEVLMEHQDIFDQPVEEMVKSKSPHYLLAWTNMFYALVLLSDRKTQRTGNDIVDAEESVATFDTMDLAEYLVDATDGMDREGDIVEAGTVQTSPLSTNMEILHGSDGI